MKTVRIIVRGDDCSKVIVSKEKSKKGFLSSVSGKKGSTVMFGKDGRKA